jgi:putative cell wall-binding protein
VLHPSTGRRRHAVALVALFGLLAAFVTPVAAQAAEAAPARATAAHTASQFDAGYIISDQVFYNGSAMTRAQIQAFLDSKVGTCQNNLCLNVLKAPTFDKAKDRDNCNAYDGGGNETAAAIIYKVQVACGVSAKVLLVTLQKEQGLITHTGPTAGRLAAAMGWNCPDKAPCDPTTASFFKQVYGAAWQFKRYKSTLAKDGGYEPFGQYRAGGRYNIRYSTNAACGTKKVSIRNHATAALYNYTPYTPNAAAMANLGKTGDGCSSYGNRNFWDYFYSWFGSPTTYVPPGSTTARVAGSDRYATAIAVAKVAFPTHADTVYVATGENYADALAAAPAAAHDNAPLLLTHTKSLPSNVRLTIQALTPQRIVVVGGEGAVSKAVFDALRAAVPGVTMVRVSGADRFETAYLLAQTTFTGPVTTAYIATGNDFPDALSASAAAGSHGGPVLLVKTVDPKLPDNPLELLRTLGVTELVLAGGTGVVSQELEDSLKAALPGVSIVRLGGANRYETSAQINAYAFDAVDSAFVASGRDYPDALSAAAIAGGLHGPLLLSNGSCIKAGPLEEIAAGGVKKIYFAGGTGVLPNAVMSYPTCA